MSSPMWEFLIEEPVPFRRVPAIGLTPPPQDGPTRDWASESLSNYKLSPGTWHWKHDYTFSRFTEAMNRSQVPESLLHVGNIPFLTPRTKGDIMSACEIQIITPLRAIARCWAIEWGLIDAGNITNGIDLEALHEAARSVRAPELAIVDERSSGRADFPVTEYEEQQAPVLIGPMRTDQIFVLSRELTGRSVRRGAQGDDWLEGTSTLDQVGTSREPRSATLSSLYKYLKPYQYFNFNTGPHMSIFKGLVAVVFQEAGFIALASQEAQQIAVDGRPLSDGSGRHEGTMTVLQQTVQSGYHYGVECVYVTDYLDVLVLKLPKHAGGEVSNDEEHETFFVDWAVVERKEAKLLLAYLLWKVMYDLRGPLEKESRFRVMNAAATTTESRAALGRPQMVSGPI